MKYTPEDFTVMERYKDAVIKRISADNVWLKHTINEIRDEIKQQISALREEFQEARKEKKPKATKPSKE